MAFTSEEVRQGSARTGRSPCAQPLLARGRRLWRLWGHRAPWIGNARYAVSDLVMGLRDPDESGASHMVDVGEKPVTQRSATASARVMVQQETTSLIRDQKLAKGDVLEVARLAGIMAAKRTSELIPLCHNLPLDSVTIELGIESPTCIRILATAKTTARTGVEMEALVAANVAALTIYDMCKAIDRGMEIGPIQLEEKSGGRSGHFVRESAAPSAVSP